MTQDNPLQQAVAVLAGGGSLSAEATAAAFGVLMLGQGTPVQTAALLMGLRAKGETAEEVAGAALALRLAMLRVEAERPERLVDTCGTGGGRVGTLNLSTAAAFVVAGAGVPVAKHGNRSYTSRSGSADVLEALGVPIEMSAATAAAVLREAGLVFLYAPSFHPAMRHVGPVRRELGVPTIMNLLGPLVNPAGVKRQVIGVADGARAPLLASALARLEPARYGLACDDLDGLAGGEPSENARRIERLLAGENGAAAIRCAVLLNAAAGLYVSGGGWTFEESVERATEALDKGAALAALERLRQASIAVSASV